MIKTHLKHTHTHTPTTSPMFQCIFLLLPCFQRSTSLTRYTSLKLYSLFHQKEDFWIRCRVATEIKTVINNAKRHSVQLELNNVQLYSLSSRIGSNDPYHKAKESKGLLQSVVTHVKTGIRIFISHQLLISLRVRVISRFFNGPAARSSIVFQFSFLTLFAKPQPCENLFNDKNYNSLSIGQPKILDPNPWNSA